MTCLMHENQENERGKFLKLKIAVGGWFFENFSIFCQNVPELCLFVRIRHVPLAKKFQAQVLTFKAYGNA